MKKAIALILALCMIFVLAACGQQAAPASPQNSETAQPAASEQPAAVEEPAETAKEPVSSVETVAFCTGRQGAGILYPFTVSLAEFMKNDGIFKDYTIIPSGTAASPTMCDSGEAQIGWCTTDVAWLAQQGIGMYEAPLTNFSLFACTYGGGLCIVTFADNNEINSVADLAGKRVNVGSAGQVQYVAADYLLQAAGMSFADLGEANGLALADACEELKNGNLDALIVYNSVPLATIIELNTTRQIKLVPLGDDVIDGMIELLPVLQKIHFEVGETYEGVTEPYDTVTNFGCIIVSNDLDEDTVYLMTKCYIEHYAELQEAVGPLKGTNGSDICMQTNGLVYHPGAIRYYTEAGLM